MFKLDELRKLMQRYMELNADEKERLSLLEKILETSKDSQEVCLRSSPIGHITASALIVCQETSRILLVKKPTWSQHLQPVGHLQEDETPLDAANRHLTWRLDLGFIRKLEYIQSDLDPLIPIDIDAHSVPANIADEEPGHTHFDFRYVFFVEDEDMLSKDTEMYRKHDPQWYGLDYLKRLNSFSKVFFKIQNLNTPQLKRRRFYGHLIAYSTSPRVSTIAVAHIIPDVTDYLMALRRCSNLLGVIAKPKSIDEDTKSLLLDKGFHLNFSARNSREQFSFVSEQITNAPSPVVLLDIGGWFSTQLKQLVDTHGDKLIGVIEDTENGLPKYEQLKPLPTPVFSAARSPLKDNEDFLIGQSIVFSTDALLRECGSLLQYSSCSVLGYGKVGSSIAHHLLMRGIKPCVYEVDPQLQLKAYNQNCDVLPWHRLLANSDVLFSATGNQALKLPDFRSLKNGCYVASVTSSDDEFDFSFLTSEYSEETITPYVRRLTGEHNYFHLICDGNAPNFIHGAVVGDFIQIVRAEMLLSIAEIASIAENKSAYNKNTFIQSLSQENRNHIAKLWLKIFTDRGLLD